MILRTERGTKKAKKPHNMMLCMQNATINARSVHLQGERNASGGVGKSEKSGAVERRMGVGAVCLHRT